MKSLQSLSRRHQLEYRATTVPLCIVVVFILCDTHALVSFILDAVFVDSYGPWLQYYTAITNILVIFNSAINFVIFYLFGSKFRQLLWNCLSCKKEEHVQSSVTSPIFRKQFSTFEQNGATYQYDRMNTANDSTGSMLTAL